MDAYLASKELRHAEEFYLNINFEVLNGCRFKCRGCYVETNAQQPMTEEQLTNFNTLMDSFENSMYSPFIAFIGPTDFLVADNFENVFDDPKIVKLFKKFKRISLQTTYLDLRKSAQVAEILNRNFSGMELEINILVDPAKILNDAYLSTIEKNKLKFLELLDFPEVRSFGIMNVYDYDKTKIADLLRDYDFMHKRVEHLFETTIDYNFSFGRSKDISNEEFLKSTSMIKDLFDQALVSDTQSEYLRFSFGKLTDSLIERQYNFRNGELYYSPLLYERFVSFRDEFRVPLKEYSAAEIENFEMQLQLMQYSTAPSKEECADCTFVATCIDRGIIHMMDIYDTRACLVAKKALYSVNGMGANG